MRYILRARKTDEGIVKTVIWKTARGVVVHTEPLGIVSRDQLEDGIAKSYSNMRGKSDTRRAKADKVFRRQPKRSESDPK